MLSTYKKFSFESLTLEFGSPQVYGKLVQVAYI